MERERLGRYELIERIDVGGMAEVFVALQHGASGFARRVAVKRILPSVATDAELVRMFLDEAKLAGQVVHPNIAQVYDLGEDDESSTFYMALELVDGRTLAALFERFSERGERMPIAATCHVIAQLADALHYAHFAEDHEGRPLGIIHRDVSPQNVMVSFEGLVKMIDFGLAKAKNRVSRTRDGIVKGKLAYLSPEQAHGKTIDRRSDIFALGICFWELLTGRRAFKREDDRETVLAIRRGVIEPPSRYAHVLPALEDIVMRALAPDPDLRYRTALELLEDLAPFARDAGLDLERRQLAGLMRATFPERFGPTEGGAIALVREKKAPGRGSFASRPSTPQPRPSSPPRPPQSAPPPPPKRKRPKLPPAEPSTEPGARTFESWSDGGDTVPSVRLPDEG